ncbi:Lrp/AsnC family transcriptional regulator [Candidatus Woesearchaeota archaeon]|nr:MAG: Lrp/AsnC family transcriptional regulator [Candidatus Woesearchaeota archaeon]
MKKSDAKVLSLLRENGRIQLTKLSRKTGLPVSTLHERIRQHIKKEEIRPTVLLDFPKMGYSCRAHMLFGVPASEKAEFISHLSSVRNVNSLWRINNGWTVAVEGVFKDMFSLEEFVEGLESRFTINRKEVCYVLDEIKREGFMSDPLLVGN